MPRGTSAAHLAALARNRARRWCKAEPSSKEPESAAGYMPRFNVLSLFRRAFLQPARHVAGDALEEVVSYLIDMLMHWGAA